MSSSTSPSRVPWTLVGLAGTLVASLAVCWLCARHQSEVYFFGLLADAQERWSVEVEREAPQKIVVFGGSSCASQHLPSRCREAGVPLVNAGLHAGLNFEDMADHAVKLTKPGDVLIVSAVPAVFARGPRFTELGLRFALMRNGLWTNNFGSENQTLERLWSVSGVASGQIGLIKRIFRKPRNKAYAVRDDASLDTGGSCTLTGNSSLDPEPAEEQKAYLKRLAAWCRDRGVRAYYKVPWEYVGPVATPERRRNRLQFLLRMSEMMPVLKEPGLGLVTDRSLFTDSAQHMTLAAAGRVTDSLISVVRSGYPCWSREELQAMLAECVGDAPSPAKPTRPDRTITNHERN